MREAAASRITGVPFVYLQKKLTKNATFLKKALDDLKIRWYYE